MQDWRVNHILHRAVILWTFWETKRRVFHRDGRKSEIASVVTRVIYKRRAPAPYSIHTALFLHVIVHIMLVLMRRRMQLRQRARKVFGMDLLVRWAFVADSPVMRRRGGRGDEELFLEFGRFQMLGGGGDVGWGAEVDADSAVHDGFAVQGLFYEGGGGDVVEGGDDAAEGF